MPHLSEHMETTSLGDQLISSLRQLFNMFESGIQEGAITQQTYFAFYLIRSLVEVKISSGTAVLEAVPPILVSDLLKTLPELFNYSIILHLHDVYKPSGRINMAKDLCILRNYNLKMTPSINNNNNDI